MYVERVEGKVSNPSRVWFIKPEFWKRVALNIACASISSHTNCPIVILIINFYLGCNLITIHQLILCIHGLITGQGEGFLGGIIGYTKKMHLIDN